MILDSLNNTKKIECLHPLFKKAFDYLKSTDFSKVEDGKHELDGSRLYVSVVSIFGKEKKDAAIETHKKYIDIQMPLLGVEKIGWKPGCELQEESTPYNEQKTSLSISTVLQPTPRSIRDSSPSISPKMAMLPVSAKVISAK